MTFFGASPKHQNGNYLIAINALNAKQKYLIWFSELFTLGLPYGGVKGDTGERGATIVITGTGETPVPL
jgi:hypothetical protein